MNTSETIQNPTGDPPIVELPKKAPGKINGVSSKKVDFTPEQIAQIIGDAMKIVYGDLAYPKPGSPCA